MIAFYIGQDVAAGKAKKMAKSIATSRIIADTAAKVTVPDTGLEDDLEDEDGLEDYVQPQDDDAGESDDDDAGESDDDSDDDQSLAPDDEMDMVDFLNQCQNMVLEIIYCYIICILQAKNGHCSFYKKCIEELVPCGRDGWALDIGRPTCLGYMNFRDDFDEEYVSSSFN